MSMVDKREAEVQYLHTEALKMQQYASQSHAEAQKTLAQAHKLQQDAENTMKEA
jgi:hypothetical protein